MFRKFSILLMLTFSSVTLSNAQDFLVRKLWTDLNVTQGGELGLVCHAEVFLTNLQGKKLQGIFYFYDGNKRRLMNPGSRYTFSDGQVQTHTNISCLRSTELKRVKCFLPYSAIPWDGRGASFYYTFYLYDSQAGDFVVEPDEQKWEIFAFHGKEENSSSSGSYSRSNNNSSSYSRNSSSSGSYSRSNNNSSSYSRSNNNSSSYSRSSSSSGSYTRSNNTQSQRKQYSTLPTFDNWYFKSLQTGYTCKVSTGYIALTKKYCLYADPFPMLKVSASVKTYPDYFELIADTEVGGYAHPFKIARDLSWVEYYGVRYDQVGTESGYQQSKELYNRLQSGTGTAPAAAPYYGGSSSYGNSTGYGTSSGSSGNPKRPCPSCGGRPLPDEIVYISNMTGQDQSRYCELCGTTGPWHNHRKRTCLQCNGLGTVGGN